MKHAFILFNLEGWTNRLVTDKEIDAKIQRRKDERAYLKIEHVGKKHFDLQVIRAGHCNNKTQRLGGWLKVVV